MSLSQQPCRYASVRPNISSPRVSKGFSWKLPYSERWKRKYENVIGEVQAVPARGGQQGQNKPGPAPTSLWVILSDKTWQLSLLTLYTTMFIHHILTTTSNRWQTCKASSLKYADATGGLINHFSPALSGFLLCLN